MKGELWLLLSDQGYSYGGFSARTSHIFSHFFLAPLCHIDLNVSVEGKIINANSPAVQPTNKTCLIHQADIAIKTTLSPLSRFSRSPLSLSHLWAPPPLFLFLFFFTTLYTFFCKNSLPEIVEGALHTPIPME